MRKMLIRFLFQLIAFAGITLIPINLGAEDLSLIYNSYKSMVHILAESGEIFNAGEEAIQDPETGRIYVVTNLVSAQAHKKGVGIVIDPAGIIATNLHIVNGSSRVTVTLHDGKQYQAEVVFINMLKDLAILRIKSEDALTPIEFSDSDQVQNGSPVFTVGSVQRSDNSISTGTIIHVERKSGASDGDVNSIQVAFDFEMTQGDSGRPIFNGSGKCIGIIAAGAMITRNSIYAIPANMIKDTFLKFVNTSNHRSS